MIVLQQSGANMLILVGMMLVFIFFIIVPQFKRQRELKKFRSSLKKGDKVVTTGGILGKVIDITDGYVTIISDEKTKLRVAKQAIVKDVTGVVQAK